MFASTILVLALIALSAFIRSILAVFDLIAQVNSIDAFSSVLAEVLRRIARNMPSDGRSIIVETWQIRMLVGVVRRVCRRSQHRLGRFGQTQGTAILAPDEKYRQTDGSPSAPHVCWKQPTSRRPLSFRRIKMIVEDEQDEPMSRLLARPRQRH